jgi:hypothetical protein
MSQLERLKTIERKIEMDELLFPKIPNIDDWNDEQINKYYDDMVNGIKEKFGLTTDAELQEYFKAMERFEEIYNTGDEKEAAKFIAGYESELMIKKWERETNKS